MPEQSARLERMPSAPHAALVKLSSFRASCAAVLALTATLSLGGCGTPGAPQPPSLRLPEPVTDLAATRTGNVVKLHWTMPRRTTDRLLISTQIHGPVPVTVWRQEDGSLRHAIGDTAFEPGVDGQFQETLPAALIAGPVGPLFYTVELKSKSGRAGRSAGQSNMAIAASGAAPRMLTGFSAEVRADGVVLHWDPNGTVGEVRLHRHLLSPSPKQEAKKIKSSGSLVKPAPEAIDRDLLVPATTYEGKPGALDSSVRVGATYEYTAQRVDHFKSRDKDIHLIDGEPTAPIRIAVIDSFPPAVPLNLAAIFVPEEKTIDLSWQPDTESDLAGYIVYRSEPSQDSWTKISGDKPLIEPAYRDTAIQSGHSYRYAVSAIDQTDHESARSSEATESVPNP